MNRMFTTCPNCKLNLAVTTSDLRIGQGHVRCGRCERVFNALQWLSEDVDQDPSGLRASGTTSLPSMDPEPLPEAPQAAQAPAAATAYGLAPDPDDTGEWAKITPIETRRNSNVDVVEMQTTGTFETIVLEGDGYLQTEEHVDEHEVDLQLQDFVDRMEADEFAQVRAELGVEEHGVGEDVVMETTDETDELDADAAVGNAPRTHWAWPVAIVGLVALLAGQVIHHHRQSLVARAWLERPLKLTYGLFGAQLEPQWNLAAYDLRALGSGAQVGNAASIVVRASVHNRAAHVQPPPMIRAVLQDRFGNSVATISIAPQDYLRGAPPSRMQPDQRLDAQLTLEDPKRQAVGFELDACLPGYDGRLHCSTDP
jgi:predicted Zn finger-like uncharacterized protein